MIDVHIFQLKNYATFYVVAAPESIRDLCAFTESHQDSGDLDASTLSERILFHNAYCCVVSESFTGWLSVRRFTRALKKRGHLINIDAYFEAFILADPEEAASVLSVPTADLIDIAKESDWGLIFEIDRDDVVGRLLNNERD